MKQILSLVIIFITLSCRVINPEDECYYDLDKNLIYQELTIKEDIRLVIDMEDFTPVLRYEFFNYDEECLVDPSMRGNIWVPTWCKKLYVTPISRNDILELHTSNNKFYGEVANAEIIVNQKYEKDVRVSPLALKNIKFEMSRGELLYLRIDYPGNCKYIDCILVCSWRTKQMILRHPEIINTNSKRAHSFLPKFLELSDLYKTYDSE